MNSDLSAPIRLRVIYRGRVQGVGFRWTTNRIARRYDVGGTVRNLPDGTVELIAQGDRTELARFLADVSSAMLASIEESTAEEMLVDADLEGFRIVR